MTKWFLLLVMGLCAPSFAYWASRSDDFGPYQDNETIQRSSPKVLDELESTQQGDRVEIRKVGTKGDRKAPIWIIRSDRTDPKDQKTSLELRIFGRKKPFRLKLGGWRIHSIASSDLNGDRKPDFLLDGYRLKGEDEGSEEGGYLSSRTGGYGVLLSSRKNYRVYWVEGASMTSRCLIQQGPGKGIAILQSADFTESKLKLDEHTRVIFHLYQLLSVRGSTLRLDNSSDKRFPKIVAQDMAATRKNHKETKLLTEARKKEVIAQHTPKIRELRFDR